MDRGGGGFVPGLIRTFCDWGEGMMRDETCRMCMLLCWHFAIGASPKVCGKSARAGTRKRELPCSRFDFCVVCVDLETSAGHPGHPAPANYGANQPGTCPDGRFALAVMEISSSMGHLRASHGLVLGSFPVPRVLPSQFPERCPLLPRQVGCGAFFSKVALFDPHFSLSGINPVSILSTMPLILLD